MENDKRSHGRFNCEGEVYYSDAFLSDKPQKYERNHKGHLVDISPCGICISTQLEYERGSKVQFSISKYYKGTYTGLVRRCIKHSDSKYHVGLEVSFSDDSTTH